MIKLPYKILFHLENESIDILEIKRSGITENDKSKLYHWLLYNKVNDMIYKLNFQDMRSVEGKEYRKFDEGELRFDKKKGTYEDKNEKQHLNLSDTNTPLSSNLKDAVNDYLLMLTLNVKDM